jgi:hypothetical protein
LFPIIKAIVISLNSLPFFPLTPGLNFFNRYIKKQSQKDDIFG